MQFFIPCYAQDILKKGLWRTCFSSSGNIALNRKIWCLTVEDSFSESIGFPANFVLYLVTQQRWGSNDLCLRSCSRLILGNKMHYLVEFRPFVIFRGYFSEQEWIIWFAMLNSNIYFLLVKITQVQTKLMAHTV